MNEKEIDALLKNIATREDIQFAESLYRLGAENNEIVITLLSSKLKELEIVELISANWKMTQDTICQLITWLLPANSQVVISDLEIQSNFNNQVMEFLGIVYDDSCVDNSTDTITYGVKNGLLGTLFGDIIAMIIFKFCDYSFESKTTTIPFSDIEVIAIRFDDDANFDSITPSLKALANILGIIARCEPQNDNDKLSTELAIEVIRAGLGRSEKNTLEEYKMAAAQVKLSCNLHGFDQLLS